MLDALRRGILLSCGNLEMTNTAPNIHSPGLDQLRKKICEAVNKLTMAERMSVLLSAATIAGIDAIASYNCGCMVNITNWSRAQLTQLNDVIQYISK